VDVVCSYFIAAKEEKEKPALHGIAYALRCIGSNVYDGWTLYRYDVADREGKKLIVVAFPDAHGRINEVWDMSNGHTDSREGER
jgi:hypothetical protein